MNLRLRFLATAAGYAVLSIGLGACALIWYIGLHGWPMVGFA